MKKKHLTFSKEALEMMEEFRKAGSFRSLSQMIEEMVRCLYYIKRSGTLVAVKIQLKRFEISIKEE